jgi:hypothetical protein
MEYFFLTFHNSSIAKAVEQVIIWLLLTSLPNEWND